MKTALPILFLIALTGCTVPPTPADPSAAVNPLKLNAPLGGGAPRDIFAGGNAEPQTVLPPSKVYFTGDLPAESSNLSLWMVLAADSPAGPFIMQPQLLFTNHFELPETNAQQFFLFYPIND